MKIEIYKLVIKNGKGIKSFSHDFGGKSAEISGENGTGKSTVMDMYLWLFSGKNGDLSASFNILPLASDGSRIDHVDAEVSAVIKIDNKKIELKKIHRQKWTKKRGSATEEYTGNTTDHYWDGVPISQTEFNNRLASIIDDSLFRTLSDVRYFCGALKPDQRRQVLIDLCGDVAPSDIFAANPKLAELDGIMSEHDLVDHKKILNQRRKRINKRIDEIPGNIKELKGMIADVSGYDPVALRKELDDLDAKIKENTHKIGELSSGVELPNLRKLLIEKNTELSKVESEMRYATANDVNIQIALKAEIEHNLITAKQIKQNAEFDLKNLERRLIANEAQREDLKKQWQESNATSFKPSPSCFACGQMLPEDQIASQLETWNTQKAEKLRQINSLGTALYKEYQEISAKKESLTDELNIAVKNITDSEDQLKKIDEKIHQINNDYQKKYAEKQSLIVHDADQIEKHIESLKESLLPDKMLLQSKINALEDEKDVVDAKLREITHAEKTTKRIAELKAEQKDLIAEYQKSEHELWMIDEYGRKRSEYIEDKVSGHFKIVQWKLFEEQQNGGIRDICEPLVNGVPYNSDLNYGAKILAGLDCIETLATHYDVRVPVFIDNAESLSKDGIVVTWPEQFIKLKVVDHQKELKIDKI